MNQTLEVFCCYASKDAQLLAQLKAHLRSLQIERLIDIWDARDVSAGAKWEQEINQYLASAQIILLLISRHFINSNYCYNVQMKEAIRRHDRGEARVIPIILRPVDWKSTPFGHLRALPTEEKPVTSWSNRDAAFLDITQGIRQAIGDFVVSMHAQSAQRESIERDTRWGSRYYPPKIVSGYGLRRVPTIISSKQDIDKFFYKHGIATFELSNSHTVICEVKRAFLFRKKITIFVDNNERYSRPLNDLDIFFGTKICMFNIEDARCVCRVLSRTEISIDVNNREVLRLTY